MTIVHIICDKDTISIHSKRARLQVSHLWKVLNFPHGKARKPLTSLNQSMTSLTSSRSATRMFQITKNIDGMFA